MIIGGSSSSLSGDPGNGSNWMLILTGLVLIVAIAAKINGWV